MMRRNWIAMVVAVLVFVPGVEAQERERAPEIAARLAEARFPQDPADEIYRRARRALTQQEYREAARLFMELRQQYTRSAYVADSYYFEALSRYRTASGGELARARALLEEQRELFPDAATRQDAASLAARVTAAMARRGDAQAAAVVRRQATQSCEEEGAGVRSAALVALLQMDSERALPILKEVLRDRDECTRELRAQAVMLLTQHVDDEVVDILVDLAHTNPDPDPEIREAAVFWLAQTQSPKALVALKAILASGEATPEVQQRALMAIGQSGDPEAVAILESYALDDSVSPELREAAIVWISQSGGSVEFLRQLYESTTDAELRERALFGIGQSGDPQSREWLFERAMDPDEDLEVRRAALFWAGQAGLDPARVARLYQSTEDREIKQHALIVLSQALEDDDRAAVDAMMEIARTETDPELKEMVIIWLGQSDDPRVPEFLLSLIRGG